MATKAYRFGLGSPDDPRSGLWRVWTHEDEIHAAVRTAEDAVEFTAYPTGRWRISVGTAVSRWNRPAEFRPGWSQGPELVIPLSPLTVRPALPDRFGSEPVTWLRPPEPGHQARFTLLFASPRAEGSRWRPTDTPGTEHLITLPLRTMGALHIGRIDEPVAGEGRAVPMLPAGATSVGLHVIVSADQAGRPSFHEEYAA